MNDSIRWRHPRVLVKYLLSRVTLVHNYCKYCGRRAEPFRVPDQIWDEIYGGDGRNVRCLRCFRADLRRRYG